MKSFRFKELSLFPASMKDRKDGGKAPYFVVQKFVYIKSEKTEEKGFRGTQNDCQSIFFLTNEKFLFI